MSIEYKKVADLPRGHREDFADVEGGGFVKKTADDELLQLEKGVADNEKMGRMTESATDILHERAKNYNDFRIAALKIADGEAVEYKGSSISDIHEIEEREAKMFREFIGKDKELLLALLKKGLSLLSYAGHSRETYKGFRDEIKVSYDNKDQAPFLNDDKDFMMETLAVDGNNYRYASERLRQDRGIVLTAVRNGLDIWNLPWNLRGDEEVVREMCNKDGRNYFKLLEIFNDSSDKGYLVNKDLALAAIKNTDGVINEFYLDKLFKIFPKDVDVIAAIAQHQPEHSELILQTKK